MRTALFWVLFEFLTLEKETERLSRNVVKELSLLFVYQPRRQQFSNLAMLTTFSTQSSPN